MVKKLIDFSLSNKFAILLMVFLVILGGVYASFKMRLELLPDTEPPMLTITTPMPGATSETVMKEISDPIDEEIRGWQGSQVLKHNLYLTPPWLRSILMKVRIWIKRNKISKSAEKVGLPDEAQTSDIKRNSMNAFPVVAYSILHDKDDVKVSTKAVKEQLIPKLQMIDGVQRATVNGQIERKVTIKFDDAETQRQGSMQNKCLTILKVRQKNLH